MNKLSIKKLLPGLISIIIVAGMAVQSFATNVDMAAFVDKEKYMTKYYELDWRIDNIEKILADLYKFTCTNVITYAGTGTYNALGSISQQNSIMSSTDTTYMFNYVHPFNILKDQKYLRVNTATAINVAASTVPNSHWQSYRKQIPGSIIKWMDGIEPAENCNIDISANLLYNNSSSMGRGFIVYEQVLIMGPFKKFTYPAGTGSNYNFAWLPPGEGLFLTDGYLSTAPSTNASYLQYAENSLTKPTTWSNLSSTGNTRLYSSTFSIGDSQAGNRFSPRDYDEFPANAFYQPKAANSGATLRWESSVPTTSLNGKKNVWLRFVLREDATSEGQSVTAPKRGDYTALVSWNIK